MLCGRIFIYFYKIANGHWNSKFLRTPMTFHQNNLIDPVFLMNVCLVWVYSQQWLTYELHLVNILDQLHISCTICRLLSLTWTSFNLDIQCPRLLSWLRHSTHNLRQGRSWVPLLSYIENGMGCKKSFPWEKAMLFNRNNDDVIDCSCVVSQGASLLYQSAVTSSSQRVSF